MNQCMEGSCLACNAPHPCVIRKPARDTAALRCILLPCFLWINRGGDLELLNVEGCVRRLVRRFGGLLLTVVVMVNL